MKPLKNILSSIERSKLIGWIVVPLVLLIAWQLAAMRLDAPWLLPLPSRILEQFCHPLRSHFSSGSLASNTIISLLRVSIGFTLAAVVGVCFGLFAGSIKPVRNLFEPILEILRPLCPIAWLPFAIAVFKLKTLPNLLGIEYSRTIFDQVQLGMIFVIFIGGFFPVFINTVDGVSGVRQNLILLGKTLGASKVQIFVRIHLPAAMPQILTGLRQGLGLCWFVIIAAEMMVGADSGIGYLLMYAADNSAMDVVIVCMLIIGAVGAAMNHLMRRCMHRYVSWKGKEF
ncbi:MAG: ABC transporter permease [Anaerohalosphaera sp.]|nr:ABC transporter permease [Anaerohalosphaera sp.]